MKSPCFSSIVVVVAAAAAAAEFPAGVDTSDRLVQLGLLDVTKAPYRADPTGTRDSTQTIQRAVNDARDYALVCFFPEGTYLISDTISCEQQVRKLDRPRNTDRRTQHYWDLSHRNVLFGSGKSNRPVLKLSNDAEGFDDPDHPKFAVWIWAQTRDDAPGKQEPEWGKEQPNINFSHYFKGIDIDIRGHAGAIGLRFSGAQGSSLLDCKVHAEGAFAGFSDCPGQGGGTYNIETVGGRYGIMIDAASRFPILVGCKFTGQTVACIGYQGSIQVPSLLVGCQLEPASGMAVDFTRYSQYAGINLVDCLISVNPGGVVAGTRKAENIHIENCHVKGATAVFQGSAALPSTEGCTLIQRYSSSTPAGVNLVNGVQSTDEISIWKAASVAPAFETLRDKHYRRVPCFDERGVVNVKDHGAKGDGETDDTAAFKKAIAAGENIFVPKGNFKLMGTLELRPNTHFFGLTRTYSSMGGGRFGRGGGGGRVRGSAQAQATGASGADEPFSIVTVDDPDAAPGFSHLGVRGDILWRSGKGTSMLAGGLPRSITGHGGGRLYGVMNMGRQLILEGLTNPLSIYAFNVERVTTNPQSVIRNCRHLRIYYFKVEAGTLGQGGDGNTPGAILDSEDVRIYCMYGNVRNLGDRPMLDVVNSDGIVVSQLKAFQPGGFPHITETLGNAKHQIASSKTCSLFVRESKPKVEVIRLDGLVPDLPIRLRESWNAIGIDPDDNVYALFGGATETASDCALFQHNARTGKTRLIGTISEALAAVGNLHANEPIPKGHTQLPYVNGKIYIGTMGFHDAVRLGSQQMEDAKTARGAHLLAYNPATDRIEDLSVKQPGGVFFKAQGFTALEKVPGKDLLVALTVPNGDVMLYDPMRPGSFSVVKGVPEEMGNYVGRVVIPVSENQVYFSYHSSDTDPELRQGGKRPGRLYVGNPAAGKRSAQPLECDAQVLNGQIHDREGRIYISSGRGFLYLLHPDSGRLEQIGSLYPENARSALADDQYRYSEPRSAGVVLSKDERKIYCLPTQRRTPIGAPATDLRARPGGQRVYGLCEFDLATRTARRLEEFSLDMLPKDIWVTGSDTRDSQGNVYFLTFDFRGYCAVLKFHVGG